MFGTSVQNYTTAYQSFFAIYNLACFFYFFKYILQKIVGSWESQIHRVVEKFSFIAIWIYVDMCNANSD